MVVETKKQVQRQDGRCARALGHMYWLLLAPGPAAGVQGMPLRASLLQSGSTSWLWTCNAWGTGWLCCAAAEHCRLWHCTEDAPAPRCASRSATPCSVVKFDKNACVLVNAKGLPLGSRVLGFVTHELRARQMMKVRGSGGVRAGGWWLPAWAPGLCTRCARAR